MKEKSEFKRGDVVSLKSGGGLFTVESEHTNEAGEKVIICKYWNKKNEKVEKVEIFSDMVSFDNSNELPQINIQVVQPDNAPPLAEREEDVQLF